MLKTIQAVFNKFDEFNITYTHWKSNERLDSFLEGESDLDLLFYPKDKERVEGIFEIIGVKKFEAVPFGKYENIEDYLLVDDQTGKLVHFHVHYGLDLGEKNVKRYDIPWVAEVLENRVQDESSKIWITSHEHELILLILREALRIPPIKRIVSKYSSHTFRFTDQVYGEFHWLKERTDKEKFKVIVSKLFEDNSSITNDFTGIYENYFSFESISLLIKNLKDFKKECQRSGSFHANFVFISDQLKSKLKSITKHFNYPKQRINPRDGLIAVLMGSDGAGKSTAVSNLAAEFGRKIDVKTIYFGLPKPEKSKVPVLVKIIRKLGLRPFWNLWVKKRNLKLALKLRSKGFLVICDRFPQSKYDGIMDGPLLADWRVSKNPIKRWLAKVENNGFEDLEKGAIDVLIKLIVDEDTSAERGKHELHLAKKKTFIVNNMSYRNAHNVYELDAVKLNIQEVKKSVVNLIWKTMP